MSETPDGCRADPTCLGSDAGSPCADDGDPCTQDRCTEAGTCAHEPCDLCSACDPALGRVAAPAIGCVHGGGSLTMTDSRDDGRDRLVWNFKSSTATDKLDFGDPLDTTDYELCVYEMGPAPVVTLEATAPAGGLCAGVPCWTETRAGFRYRDKALTPDGIATIDLKASAAPRKSTIRVKGKGPLLGMPHSLASPLTVQLRKSDGPACWETTHSRIVRSGKTLEAKAD